MKHKLSSQPTTTSDKGFCYVAQPQKINYFVTSYPFPSLCHVMHSICDITAHSTVWMVKQTYSGLQQKYDNQLLSRGYEGQHLAVCISCSSITHSITSHRKINYGTTCYKRVLAVGRSHHHQTQHHYHPSRSKKNFNHQFYITTQAVRCFLKPQAYIAS